MQPYMALLEPNLTEWTNALEASNVRQQIMAAMLNGKAVDPYRLYKNAGLLTQWNTFSEVVINVAHNEKDRAIMFKAQDTARRETVNWYRNIEYLLHEVQRTMAGYDVRLLIDTLTHSHLSAGLDKFARQFDQLRIGSVNDALYQASKANASQVEASTPHDKVQTP